MLTLRQPCLGSGRLARERSLVPGERTQPRRPMVLALSQGPGQDGEGSGRQDNWTPEGSPAGQQWRGDKSFKQVREQYIKPYYLPGSFAVGTLTFGLKTAADNFSITSDPLGFLGTAIVSGLIIMATAWILYDFTEEPARRNQYSRRR